MKVIHRLILRYTVTLILLGLMVFFFVVLPNYGIGVLFMAAVPLANWLLDPIPQGSKHLRVMTICGLFFIAIILSMGLMVLLQNRAQSKFHSWIGRVWLYGFVCPGSIAMAVWGISAQIKAARELDREKIEKREDQ